MNFLTKATISYKLMPVKPQQNWIIKSVSQYPITAYLWIVDFILYNWQGRAASSQSEPFRGGLGFEMQRDMYRPVVQRAGSH